MDQDANALDYASDSRHSYSCRPNGSADFPPEWAQQEPWNEVIRKLCVPCKEHGTFPVLCEQFLALAKDSPLALGKLTVHCSNKDRNYYAEDYSPLSGMI